MTARTMFKLGQFSLFTSITVSFQSRICVARLAGSVAKAVFSSSQHMKRFSLENICLGRAPCEFNYMTSGLVLDHMWLVWRAKRQAPVCIPPGGHAFMR